MKSISNTKQPNLPWHLLKTVNWFSFKRLLLPWASKKCLPIAEFLCSAMRWWMCRAVYPTLSASVCIGFPEVSPKATGVFMVTSSVSFRLTFHWLDLLMDFYCKNRCWTRKEICDFYIVLTEIWLDCLGWCKKRSSSTLFYFLYFLYVRKYCNDTQLMQIARNQSLGCKIEKNTCKKYKKWPRPRPRVLLTPANNIFNFFFLP